MKVNIKVYKEKEAYESDDTPNRALLKDTIGEALEYCKDKIRTSHKFIGFRIESTKGELKHKLHNQ